MSTKPTQSSESAGDTDVKKRGAASARDAANNLSDAISKTHKSTADLAGGVAEAVAGGFRAYSEEVNADNISKWGPDNGVFAGTLSAMAKFFEELAKTTRQVRDDLRAAPVVEAKVEIDYDKLSTMVADKLRGNVPNR